MTPKQRILEHERAKHRSNEPPDMTQAQHKEIVRSARKIPSKYMMGTNALHLLGDISREKPDLLHVYAETDQYYVGAWVTGFGFFDVLFEKETTRELTAEEIAYWNTRAVQIGSQPARKLKVD